MLPVNDKDMAFILVLKDFTPISSLKYNRFTGYMLWLSINRKKNGRKTKRENRISFLNLRHIN